MAEDIFIRVTDIHDKEYQQIYNLRESILRIPIGLSLKDEDLSGDVRDIILVAQHGETVVGCLMLHPTDIDREIKLRQMAIDNKWQRRGIGGILVSAAEETVKNRNINKVILHARVSALDFYLKLGYLQTSDVFTEVGIPHVVMEKELF